ncbi:Pogo transposable element with KRAB domain, partial [Aphis craccivora]
MGKRSYRNQPSDVIEEVLNKIVNGEMSILAARMQYHIPYGTLYNRYNGLHGNKPGGQPILNEAEEKLLLAAVTKCDKSFLDKKGIVVKTFKKNLPGDNWARSVLKRHQILGKRIATNISKSCAEVSHTTINLYFNNLATVLKDVPSKKKFLFQRGIKYPVRVQNHTKSATIIIVCGYSGGILLPPYIGSRFNCTSHGWIDANTFKYWFFTTFLLHAKRLTGRKVLISDNLPSHFNDDVIKDAPLVVCFFRPLKQAWRYTLNKWKNNNTRLYGIPKSTFPSIVRECLEHINDVGCISDNLKSGFRATGIYSTIDIVTSALLGRPDSDGDSPDNVIQYANSEPENGIEDNVPKYEKPNDTNLKIGSFLL